jgi:transposase
LDCLKHQIKTLEQTVQKRLHHTPSYAQLLTVAGIGPILAQTIALETGAISRFPNVGHYASYCRWVDGIVSKGGYEPVDKLTLFRGIYRHSFFHKAIYYKYIALLNGNE